MKVLKWFRNIGEFYSIIVKSFNYSKCFAKSSEVILPQAKKGSDTPTTYTVSDSV